MQVNPAETGLMYRNIVADRDYLRHGVELGPGSTVFDVGANIGLASLFFHWERPDVRIFAFEPAHPLFEALQANMRDHRVNAVCYDCALSNRTGSARLVCYPHITAMSSLYADVEHDIGITRQFLANSGFGSDDVEDMVVGRHETHSTTCELRTLSDVIAANGVEVVDLLKVNVEKSELDVLDGLDDADWPRVRQAAVQVHDIDGRVASLRGRLERLGFRTALDQDALLAGTDIYDVFAVRAA